MAFVWSGVARFGFSQINSYLYQICVWKVVAGIPNFSPNNTRTDIERYVYKWSLITAKRLHGLEFAKRFFTSISNRGF